MKMERERVPLHLHLLSHYARMQLILKLTSTPTTPLLISSQIHSGTTALWAHFGDIKIRVPKHNTEGQSPSATGGGALHPLVYLL